MGIFMNNFLNKIIDVVLFINRIILEKKYRVKLDAKTNISVGTTKKVFLGDEVLELTSETLKNRDELNKKVAKIVKENLKTPQKLFNYIERNGTHVYKLNNADVILNVIKEEEGFITELKGFKALYLNFMIALLKEKTISFKFYTPAMFVLRDMEVDPYYMSHQFYKWFGYKMKLPGYDYKTQENFKATFKTLSNKDISKLSLDEIVAVKEAINRDNEAIDFVLNLCRENATSKKVLLKILKGQGATV